MGTKLIPFGTAYEMRKLGIDACIAIQNWTEELLVRVDPNMIFDAELFFEQMLEELRSRKEIELKHFGTLPVWRP